MHPTLDQLKGSVIVSVQASEGEPLHDVAVITALAQSVMSGGAMGLRMANEAFIQSVRKVLPTVPIIGITKPPVIPANAKEQVYITPDLASAVRVIEAGATMVAMDATLRPRPSGETLSYMVRSLKLQYPDILLMADVSTVKEAEAAEALGFDVVGTTLVGYTEDTKHQAETEAPDFDVLQAMVNVLTVPVVLEGRVWEPAHVSRGFELGAHAVVIGSAITRPHLVTQRFVKAAPKAIGGNLHS